MEAVDDAEVERAWGIGSGDGEWCLDQLYGSLSRSGVERGVVPFADGDGGGTFPVVCGVFGRAALFHTQNFHAQGLARHAATGFLASSIRSEAGTAAIIVMNGDGTERREVTGGDSIDTSPSWVPGDGFRIVYGSAGIARDLQGNSVTIGPSTICCLDLQSRQIETLLEDAQFDFMAPRMTAGGDLYCIRRPYQSERGIGPAALLVDWLMMPFRLILTLYSVLNVLSIFMTQKPLISTSMGNQAKRNEPLAILVRGRWIETNKVLSREGDEHVRGLVPDDWVLLRRRADGGEEVLAKGVVAFDLSEEGELFYTNGRAIFEGGSNRVLHRHGVIEDFIVLPG